MKAIKTIVIFLFVCTSLLPQELSTVRTSGNPVFKGWYADPEAIIFGDTYWIYPTYSAHGDIPDSSSLFTDWQINERKNDKIWSPFLLQTFFNAFSSKDLVTWEKHSHVLDVKDVKWAAYSLWAPSIIKKDNKYFFYIVSACYKQFFGQEQELVHGCGRLKIV